MVTLHCHTQKRIVSLRIIYVNSWAREHMQNSYFWHLGPIRTRPYIYFSWIRRPNHETKTKYGLVRIGPLFENGAVRPSEPLMPVCLARPNVCPSPHAPLNLWLIRLSIKFANWWDWWPSAGPYIVILAKKKMIILKLNKRFTLKHKFDNAIKLAWGGR